MKVACASCFKAAEDPQDWTERRDGSFSCPDCMPPPKVVPEDELLKQARDLHQSVPDTVEGVVARLEALALLRERGEIR